jgi:hypothetical protein
VPGIFAGQLGLAAVNPVYKKSTPRQGAIVQWALTGGVCCWRCGVAKTRLWTGRNACPTMKHDL